MNRITTRVLLPGITILLGLLWLFVGVVHYGWWSDGRPASGFFPSLVGILLAVTSVLALGNELKRKDPVFTILHGYPILAALGVVLGALLIGFFPALGLYLFGWLKWYERYRVRFSLAATVVTVGAMYGVFALWLRVPFPRGLILRWIVG